MIQAGTIVKLRKDAAYHLWTTQSESDLSHTCWFRFGEVGIVICAQRSEIDWVFYMVLCNDGIGWIGDTRLSEA